jgi:heterodisulfide reductase subunit C
MDYLPNIIFTVLFIAASGFFAYNVRKIIRNIKLGRDIDRTDRKNERWKIMTRVALGQSKMVKRPVAGLLHIFVYIGFIIINIEVIEIVIDGIFGTHRVLAEYLPIKLYTFLIASFEILALLVFVGCAIFLVRRNIVKIPRFHLKEMTKWPKNDANIILIFELALMSAFLFMNGAEAAMMGGNASGAFPVSSALSGMLPDNAETLHSIERFCWWFHIVGIFIFLNYLPYSKHFHIILAFPNVFYSNLNPKGSLTNMESVKKEVELMFDPSVDPYAAPPEPPGEGEVQRFGAKDVTDLTWKNLMDAYSCTECGRCSSECPANQTGKLLSPRKIMMDTRDRLEEVGKNVDKNGEFKDDGKSLLGDYITEEELRACTTCNACTEACPVNIDPLSIIVDLRRFLIMEESKSPEEWTVMFTNIENNGAPWQFSPTDRFNWAEEEGLEIKASNE